MELFALIGAATFVILTVRTSGCFVILFECEQEARHEVGVD